MNIISMVQLGRHGPLDCIYDLSSGWKGCRIRLLATLEQRRIQAFRKYPAIVSDDTPHALKVRMKFVVDTSFHTVLTESTWKTPTAMIGGLRKTSKSMATNWW
jgi:hypothetical protein